MPKLTVADLTAESPNRIALREMAEHLAKTSTLIDEFRHENYSTLTREERKQLSDLAYDLLHASNRIIEDLINSILEDVQKSVSKLNSATGKATAAVKQINNVKSVIKLGASLIGAYWGLVSGDLKGLSTAVKSIVEITKSIRTDGN